MFLPQWFENRLHVRRSPEPQREREKEREREREIER